MRSTILLLACVVSSSCLFSCREGPGPGTKTGPDPLAGFEINGRTWISLDGDWKATEDPMRTFYKRAIWRGEGPRVREPKEYDWSLMSEMPVPGSWNLESPRLYYYEGLVWYGRRFPAPPGDGKRVFLFFEGANYSAEVYLNGERLGERRIGFLPFWFEVTGKLKSDNFLVVAVDNRRESWRIPAMSFDWFNYGGLYRPVGLVVVPRTFIRDYRFKPVLGKDGWSAEVEVALDGTGRPEVTVSFPGLGVSARGTPGEDGVARVVIPLDPEPWTPENPRLYELVIKAGSDVLRDKVGFRSLQVSGRELLLNGRPVFLKGVCLHEEAPGARGRSLAADDVRWLFKQIKELNGNFARLAHYPHSRAAARIADQMGIILWEEVPVYWDIDFANPVTINITREMLYGLYLRDKNRASVALWSVSNETGGGADQARTRFFKTMVGLMRSLDDTRWITSANNTARRQGLTVSVSDPTAELLDVYGINEYYGWYGFGSPEERRKISELRWKFPYQMPVIVSEFGAGALYGYRGGPNDYWTEDFQEYTYRRQLAMLDRLDFAKGLSPWILLDFRSPRRLHPKWQKGYNRKGLMDERGRRKKAFAVLAAYYAGKRTGN